MSGITPLLAPNGISRRFRKHWPVTQARSASDGLGSPSLARRACVASPSSHQSAPKPSAARNLEAVLQRIRRAGRSASGQWARKSQELQSFDPEAVRAQKIFALGPRKDTGGCPDGTHATGTQSTRHAQAVLGVKIMEQAPDIARIESITAAAAVHERDRVRAGASAPCR